MNKLSIIIFIIFISSCLKREGVVTNKFVEEGIMEEYIYFNVVLKMPLKATRFDDKDFVLIIDDGNRIEVDSITYLKTKIGKNISFN